MDSRVLASMLGYLNFSDGTPAAPFRRQLSDFFRSCVGQKDVVASLFAALEAELDRLGGEESAFRDSAQARAILSVVRDEILPGYLAHHRDLLAHLTPAEVFQPFFLAKTFEVALRVVAEPAPAESRRARALDRLNDFLGHRPLAVLENKRQMQPYDHERLALEPVYFRDVGLAFGPYEELFAETFAILDAADPDLLAEVYFERERLEELAIDPRAYDHGHPVNQRPGYQFGEWDPHRLDTKGQYSRFVVRRMILDALLEWSKGDKNRDSAEARFEAAAALAGTMLLASGICGRGPEGHGPDFSLGRLVPKIAQCRDRFYDQLIGQLEGPRAERLRAEQAETHQPFGGVRQFLNRHVSTLRAKQLVADHLAQAYAVMGHAAPARSQARVIPVPRVRMRAELNVLLSSGHLRLDRGLLAEAAQTADEIDELLHRAIGCGALVDPWNILGFAGQFSLFPSPENSVTDPRIDELLDLMEAILDFRGRLTRELAARGDEPGRVRAEMSLRGLADWWDQFASISVTDLPRVSGRETCESALFVARALAAWREAGAAAGDIAFWRRHADDFTTPQAFATVVEALLEHEDLVASMALIMRWLSQSDVVPLEEGDYSFFEVTDRWIDAATAAEPAVAMDLCARFFDHLEANAESLWHPPTLDEDFEEDDEEDVYSAAYDEVTYRDTTADGHEGEMIDDGPPLEGDALAELAEHLELRLDFLQAVAEWWIVASALPWSSRASEKRQSQPVDWARRALANARTLERLMDQLHEFEITRPLGSQDSVIEFDRQLEIKRSLLGDTIGTSLSMAEAARALAAAVDMTPNGMSEGELLALEVERALRAGDKDRVRHGLEVLLTRLSGAQLLYVPLDQGGRPREIAQSRAIRDVLRRLASRMPTLGLFHETYSLLEAALRIEGQQASNSQQVTEFNLLFPVAFRGVAAKLTEALGEWPATRRNDEMATSIVGAMVGRFSKLWIRHVSSVRLSEIERRADEASWSATIAFIREYGHDLFTQRFLTFGNLRGILHDGVATFIDRLATDQDEEPTRLAGDLGVKITRAAAVENLEFILRVLIENYDAYKDYNTTTTQSDYGENLHLLFELLRVQAAYDRHRWALQPAYLAHGILASRGRPGAAILLERAFMEETRAIANEYERRYAETAKRTGLRLASVADRIGERFVQPLWLDRVLALVGPSVVEARGDSPPAAFPIMAREIERLSAAAGGVGLDPPAWLRQFEDEVDRVIRGETDDETLLQPPGPPLTFEEFKEQLQQWDAAEPEG